eukprot:TCONS_00000584-protein
MVNLAQYLRCEIIHKKTEFAEPAARIIAKQWNHKDFELNRNLRSMVQDGRDSLPCHLALVLNIPQDVEIPGVTNSSGDVEQSKNIDHSDEITSSSSGDQDKNSQELRLPAGEDIVVGHVKIAKADGRSDGACCISYSLVVDSDYRGLGFGRVLTERAEDYARSLGLSYMYLSTDDKVTFYEHLGYNQCEAVSSLGNNSKLLNANQVSALEGLFAKRINMSPPADSNCNTWLRKRLLDEYPIKPAMENVKLLPMLSQKMANLYGDVESVKCCNYVCFCIPIPWQQQAGPSCGVSALNMANESVKGQSTKREGEELNICKECVKDASLEKIESGLSALRTALKLGVSSDGELFCAYNFSLVGQLALGLHTNVLTNWDVSVSVNEILAGYPFLVPYDRSLSDHRPGTFLGGKAHWCIVAGLIIPVSGNRDSELISPIDFPNAVSTLSLVDDREAFKEKYEEGISKIDETLILVCIHSMSKSPFLCTFKELRDSNQQLECSKSKFYMAPESLSHLKCKFLTINH